MQPRTHFKISDTCELKKNPSIFIRQRVGGVSPGLRHLNGCAHSLALIHMSLSDVCSANPLNPSQQRRSKSPRRVLQFLPAVTARNSCGGRCRRTEPPCVMLCFLSSSCVKTVRRRGSGCRVCHDWSREAELSSSVDRPLCRPADCRYSRGDQGHL